MAYFNCEDDEILIVHLNIKNWSWQGVLGAEVATDVFYMYPH